MSMSENSSAYLITTVAVLGGLVAFYFLKIYDSKPALEEETEPEDDYTPLEPRDFTLEELKEFNGEGDSPVCIAVNGTVYDVTKGKSFYGPGGPYAALAGHDGSRALATMSLDETAIKPEWDELDDLTPFQMDALNDWVMTFQTKYTEVGDLIKSRD